MIPPTAYASAIVRALFQARIVLGVAPRREIASEAHCNRAGCDLGETGGDDEAGLRDRPG